MGGITPQRMKNNGYFTWTGASYFVFRVVCVYFIYKEIEYKIE